MDDGRKEGAMDGGCTLGSLGLLNKGAAGVYLEEAERSRGGKLPPTSLTERRKRERKRQGDRARRGGRCSLRSGSPPWPRRRWR